MSDWNANIIEEFRANGGKVGGQFEGGDLLLLTTIGAKSGLPRTSPLAYLRDGDRLVIIASAAGSDSNPDWYYNLLANPTATVEIGTEQVKATATPITSRPERDRLFAAMVAKRPGFADYQAKTKRVIPVIVLDITG